MKQQQFHIVVRDGLREGVVNERLSQLCCERTLVARPRLVSSLQLSAANAANGRTERETAGLVLD